jgi:lipopolysaccharide export system protein LptA
MAKNTYKWGIVLAALLLAVMVCQSECKAKKQGSDLSGVLLPYTPSYNRGIESKSAASPTEKNRQNKASPITKTEVSNGTETTSSKGKKEKSPPISITALRMEADNKEGWVLFIGKVKAIQKDMVLTTEKLRVYLDPKGKVKRVIAQGKVRVEQAGRVITSQKAEYDPLKEIVVFTGNPKAWQGKNVVMGKRIIYFVKEKRSTVEGGKGKVSAVLFPKENKGGK